MEIWSRESGRKRESVVAADTPSTVIIIISVCSKDGLFFWSPKIECEFMNKHTHILPLWWCLLVSPTIIVLLDTIANMRILDLYFASFRRLCAYFQAARAIAHTSPFIKNSQNTAHISNRSGIECYSIAKWRSKNFALDPSQTRVRLCACIVFPSTWIQFGHIPILFAPKSILLPFEWSFSIN